LIVERNATIERAFVFDLEARTSDDAIPVVVSTDDVVEVADGPEILVHSPDAIDMARAPLPIIATHRGGQINVGIVDDLRIDGGRLRGMAKFGQRQEAAEYKADVLGGIIRSVSAGYRRIKGHIRKDGVLITTRWRPNHVAMVAEPADAGAGFYREAAPRFELEQEPTTAAPAAPERKTMTVETQAAAGADAEHQQQQDQTRSLPAQPRQGPSGAEMEASRKVAIERLCKAGNIPNATRDMWITAGWDWDKVSEDYLQIQQQRAEQTKKQQASAIGLSDAEAKRFSIFNAVNAVINKNWSKAGFEAECSRAIAHKLNRLPDEHKFFVPFEVQQQPIRGAQRDLTVATSSAGGYLVGTENTSFIELMRNRSVVYRAGARRLAGLVGNVTVPKQTAAGTAVWLANEASTATESAQTFGQMSLSPKTVGAYTEISRNLLLQSSPDAEGIVKSDLAAVCALAVDVGALRGAGSSGEPQGIVGTSGVGAVTGTSLAAAGVLEFQSDVAGGNLLSETFAYVTTPAVAALLMARPELPSTGTTRLWMGSMLEGSLFGMRAFTSNQMSSATMLAGDFSQVVIAEWGVLEVEVNPYANFQAGIVGVRAMVTIDVGVRYGGAFSYASSIT
jgi:HK97 family phage major capsid protein